MKRRHYERATEYTADAYRVAGSDGIAYDVLGWETEPDEDTDWTGIEERTGMLVVQMIGDDRHFVVDPDDVTPLDEDEYCPECGQIGCQCNQC